MIWIDLSHTARTGANTGIQRVCRFIYGYLEAQGSARAILYDRTARCWRFPYQSELKRLHWNERRRPERRRRPRPTVEEKVRDVANYWLRRRNQARWVGENPLTVPAPELILVPELPHPTNWGGLSLLRERFPRTPQVAVFHDAAAYLLPGLSPPETVQRYPDYMRMLARMDGVAAVSEASAADLHSFWLREGMEGLPLLASIRLGVAPLGNLAQRIRETQPVRDPHEGLLGGPVSSRAGRPPEVLCVATIEGRKNHTALLRACGRLWDKGYQFSLTLMGGYNRETASAAMTQLEMLQAAERPVVWHRLPSDRELTAAYQRCEIFAYPSLHEGFGLPVEEALSWGKPCLLTPFGALPERALHGGCLVARDGSPEAVMEGLEALLGDIALRARLAREASERPMRTLGEWAEEISLWAREVSRRRPGTAQVAPAVERPVALAH